MNYSKIQSERRLECDQFNPDPATGEISATESLSNVSPWPSYQTRPQVASYSSLVPQDIKRSRNFHKTQQFMSSTSSEHPKFTKLPTQATRPFSYPDSSDQTEMPQCSREESSDALWNDEVMRFGRSMVQSSIDTTKAKLAKFANKCKPMISSFENEILKTGKSLVNELSEEEFCACMPPVETFIGIPKMSRKKQFHKYLNKGDILCVKIIAKTDNGFLCQVLCMDGGKRRDIHDCDIKAFCPSSHWQQLSVNHPEFENGYQVGDLLRVVVINYIIHEMKIIISMKGDSLSKDDREKFKLGLINDEELPVHYRRQISMKSTNYDEMLKKTLSFNNPGATLHLSSVFELPEYKRLSFLNDFNGVFYPEDESASFLRRIQSQNSAKQSVEDGVVFLKSGKYLEASQCLNKALQIDPDNIDALVARGCVYANTNSLLKASEDFEKALAIDPSHVNGRKYLTETLLELGKSMEEQGNLDGAIEKFRKVCQIDVKNVHALEALKVLTETKKMRSHVFKQSRRHSETKKEPDTPKDSSLQETSHKLKLLIESDRKKKKKRHKRSSSSSSIGSKSSRESSTCSSYSSKNSYHSKSRKSHRRHRKNSSHSKSERKSKRKSKTHDKCDRSSPIIREKSPFSRSSQLVAPNDDNFGESSSKQSEKISFVIKRPEIETKTLLPSRSFSSFTRSTPLSDKVVYNLDKLRTEPITLDRRSRDEKRPPSEKPSSNKSSNLHSSSSRRLLTRSHPYSRSRSRSHSRSRSRSRANARLRETRSRTRSRSQSKGSQRSKVYSPHFRYHRNSLRQYEKNSYSPYRRGKWSRERSPSRKICRAPDPQNLRNKIQDKLKRAVEEARKVEALVNQDLQGISCVVSLPK